MGEKEYLLIKQAQFYVLMCLPLTKTGYSLDRGKDLRLIKILSQLLKESRDMKIGGKACDHLDSYILFLISKSKLIDAKTILFKVKYEYGETLQYNELMVRLKILKSIHEIEPVVMDEKKITPSSLWRLNSK